MDAATPAGRRKSSCGSMRRCGAWPRSSRAKPRPRGLRGRDRRRASCSARSGRRCCGSRARSGRASWPAGPTARRRPCRSGIGERSTVAGSSADAAHRRPVRIEDFDEVGGGAVGGLMRELGIRSGPAARSCSAAGCGVPCRRSGPMVLMPAGAEDRVGAFAELVSYAIENAETREELAASRARLVEAADEARRRIERDLHDGAQQRFVAAALELTMLDDGWSATPPGRGACWPGRESISTAASASFAIWRAASTRRCSPSAGSKLPSSRWSSGRRCRSTCAPWSRSGSTRRSRRPPTSSSPRHSPTSPSTPGRHGQRGRRVHRWHAGRHDRRRRHRRRRPDGSGLRGLVDRVQAVGGRLEVTARPAGHATVRSTAHERARLAERGH